MQYGWDRRGLGTQDRLVLEGFIDAYDAELDYLFASLRRLGARPDEIEDLAHQVFLLLLRTWPPQAQRRSLRLHLFALAVRVIVKRRRRASEKVTDSSRSLSLTLAALDQVPPKRRAVLILSELDHVPLPDIAESLSMTRLGVALRLRKAQRQLQLAIQRLRADWRARRFEHPDLLLAALGIRLGEGDRDDARAAGAESSDDRHPSEVASEILQLQDDVFLLKMVMDDLRETIYFKDRQSRFTHINRYAAAHYGIPDPAVAVGRTDFDFFTDEHARQALRDEQEIIRTGRPLVSIEEQETLPDGKLRRVWTTKLPLRDGGGDIVGTFGLSRDISEQSPAP